MNRPALFLVLVVVVAIAAGCRPSRVVPEPATAAVAPTKAASAPIASPPAPVSAQDDAAPFFAADAAAAGAWLDAHPSPARSVVVWVDRTRLDRPRAGRIHVATPLDGEPTDGSARRFEHRVISSPDQDLATRLVAQGLWPSATGLDIMRVLDDGTREVRALGYLNPYLDEPERRLSLAAEDYTAVRLSSSPAIAASLRTIAKSGRGKLVGPAGAMLSEDRERTLIPAVGTCGRHTWVSGVAVVIAGKARIPVGSGPSRLEIEVERVEATVPASRWLALAPRYARALETVSRSVAKRGAVSPEDGAPLEAIHRDIRAAFGSSAPLFEIDGVVAGLRDAFARGSASAVLEALALRCRGTAEEQALETTLRALPAVVTEVDQ